MTREEGKEFASALKNNYTIDFDKISDFCDLVISALEKNESAEEWYKLLCEKWDSAENKGEWIPVSERLPEKDMACLVAVGQFNLTQIAMYSNLMRTISHRIFYQGDPGFDSFMDITEYVRAWQPLPEPYKKESED